MDFRPILYVIGALLSILAISMTIPMLVDMYAGNDDWTVFFICIATTAFFGGTLVLTNAGNGISELSIRQAFVLTTLSWIAMATFGALPIWLSHEKISFTNAFFESMSGITTTGSTVIVGLDSMPPGTLIWRSMLNWLGGIGFILMAILILPFLKVGGMQLFRTESSDKSEKALPRLQRLGMMTGIVYVMLTALCTLSFWALGMSGFDAVNHAMSTLATGGLSTHDASLGFFKSPAILIVASFFMILGSLPFVLYVRSINGDSKALFQNGQIRTFLLVLIIATISMTIWLDYTNILPLNDALVHSAFNIVSVVSTTGYSSTDYMQWGSFPIIIFCVIMFFGGCTGSTSGGIKIMRFEVMGLILRRHLHKLIQPGVVITLRYENRTVTDEVAYSVMVFIFTFLMCFGLLSLALGLTGLDLVTAVSGAATALTNVGPGLGDIIGPAGNFAPLPDTAKWLLAFGMLLGRLELFTVLVLLTPHFWRR